MSFLTTPVAYFTVESTNVSANTTLSVLATAGVEVPQSRRHERVHFAVDKNAAANIDIYGYANFFGAGSWLRVERLSLSHSAGEVQALVGIASFKRLQSVCQSMEANGYLLNVSWGFSE